jgi:hypothetical protein
VAIRTGQGILHADQPTLAVRALAADGEITAGLHQERYSDGRELGRGAAHRQSLAHP